MLHKKSGSALLIIMLIINGITLICLLVWRSTSFSVDLIIAKQEYEKQMQALRSLSYYASMIIKNNYDSFLQGQLQRTMHFDHWPTQESKHRAEITIEPDTARLHCICAMYKQNKISASNSFFVRQQKVGDDTIFIVESDDKQVC